MDLLDSESVTANNNDRKRDAIISTIFRLIREFQNRPDDDDPDQRSARLEAFRRDFEAISKKVTDAAFDFPDIGDPPDHPHTLIRNYLIQIGASLTQEKRLVDDKKEREKIVTNTKILPGA